MAATIDEEINSLLSSFDHIYEALKNLLSVWLLRKHEKIEMKIYLFIYFSEGFQERYHGNSNSEIKFECRD